VSRLPGEYGLTGVLAMKVAGGYHNEYVTLLAEQGLLGLLPALALAWFLLYATWRLGFRRWHTWGGGRWPLFVCLFLLIRANLEVPGLFGYAQEPADYLAYIFLAIVVSRLSAEEDYIRSSSPSAARLTLRSRTGNIALQPRYASSEGRS
jgi:O-antigen ligase